MWQISFLNKRFLQNQFVINFEEVIAKIRFSSFSTIWNNCPNLNTNPNKNYKHKYKYKYIQMHYLLLPILQTQMSLDLTIALCRFLFRKMSIGKFNLHVSFSLGSFVSDKNICALSLSFTYLGASWLQAHKPANLQ